MMSSRSLEVELNPNVLLWARKSLGLEPAVAATRAKVSAETLAAWESGKKSPTVKQLEKLSDVYKRPLAAFFLPVPPEDTPLPTDFRVRPANRGKPLSPATRLAIRRARRLQSSAVALAENVKGGKPSRLIHNKLSDDPEVSAVAARKLLGITPEDQSSWKDERVALNRWRSSLESLGVLVFQFGMPTDEIEGFSLAHNVFPAIVINSKDFVRSRIFSLLHEYSHLLLDDPGLCDIGDETAIIEGTMSVESFCNRVAEAILVPKNALFESELVRSGRPPTRWSDEDFKTLSRQFQVSGWVILLRLVHLGLASQQFYWKKDREWKSRIKPRKSGGRTNPPARCLREHGASFVSLALENLHQKKISHGDVADLLSTRLKYITRVERLLTGKG